MFPAYIDDGIVLRPLEAPDSAAMFDLIARNRAHLDPWLRWSGRIKAREDAEQLIQRFAAKYAAGDGFHAGLWVDEVLAGGIVAHFINRESCKTEIGYWLGAEFTGKGLVTRACRVVIDSLFADEQLHRIEIQCVTDNQRSRAVAERLGFRFEGIKRESEWITSAFRDHALYALLDYEWRRTRDSASDV